ncbi:GNAT family N-acetyltransferase [Cryobacterium cheniae]|nr:GNAT family N-acetyltransferase [Cryobacterium cheniae]
MTLHHVNTPTGMAESVFHTKSRDVRQPCQDDLIIMSGPWQHPKPQQSQLRLVKIPELVLHALALGKAEGISAEFVTPYVAGSECTNLWRMRSEQIVNTPEDAPWITRFVVVPNVRTPVGLAGFHGAPDEVGIVEIGYRIDPEHRRQGYARQALETLLDIAKNHPNVQIVRATISPDNIASRALVDAYGFREVGDQWDDEDGLEIILEVAT